MSPLSFLNKLRFVSVLIMAFFRTIKKVRQKKPTDNFDGAKKIYIILRKKIILCNQSLLFQIKEIAWTTISGDSANDSCVCVSLVNLYMAIKWFTNDLNNIMDTIYEQILLNISKALSRLYVQCETKVSKCDGQCVWLWGDTVIQVTVTGSFRTFDS